MKKHLFKIVILLLCLSVNFAQVNPRGEATVELSGGTVTINYGRPSLKGRDISTMISPGEQWRLGADGSTTLTTKVALTFGDQQIEKGTYTLRGKFVSEGKWYLLIHSQDYTKVAEIPLILEKSAENIDRLTMILSGQGKNGSFQLKWGKLSLSVGFSGS
ncbi:MAG: DUF2911 domain-containing protein [Acidobacteriia bacterium]|nr:DUF2911 domain-containing protein [Terriglobia bacterium]